MQKTRQILSDCFFFLNIEAAAGLVKIDLGGRRFWLIESYVLFAHLANELDAT